MLLEQWKNGKMEKWNNGKLEEWNNRGMGKGIKTEEANLLNKLRFSGTPNFPIFQYSICSLNNELNQTIERLHFM